MVDFRGYDDSGGGAITREEYLRRREAEAVKAPVELRDGRPTSRMFRAEKLT